MLDLNKYFTSVQAVKTPLKTLYARPCSHENTPRLASAKKTKSAPRRSLFVDPSNSLALHFSTQTSHPVLLSFVTDFKEVHSRSNSRKRDHSGDEVVEEGDLNFQLDPRINLAQLEVELSAGLLEDLEAELAKQENR
jgi:hypothetical protein